MNYEFRELWRLNIALNKMKIEMLDRQEKLKKNGLSLDKKGRIKLQVNEIPIEIGEMKAILKKNGDIIPIWEREWISREEALKIFPDKSDDEQGSEAH